LKVSTEWNILILGGNELKTVGTATENARRANSVRTTGTNSRGASAEHFSLTRRCDGQHVMEI